MGLDTGEMVIVVVVLAIIGSKVWEYLLQASLETKASLLAMGWKLYLIIFLMILPFIIYLVYRIKKNIQKKKLEAEQRGEWISDQRERIRTLLNKRTHGSTEELLKRLKALEEEQNKIGGYPELDEEDARLDIKIEKARKFLEKSELEDRIKRFHEREDNARKEAEYWE